MFSADPVMAMPSYDSNGEGRTGFSSAGEKMSMSASGAIYRKVAA